MTPERKRELDVLVEAWEVRKHPEYLAGKLPMFPRALLDVAGPSLPNLEPFLEKTAGELGISLDELLEWKKLDVEEHVS